MNMQWWGNDNGAAMLYAPEETVRELARIRFVLKDSLRGDKEKCIEARERLERVLDELDSAWRTLA